MTRKRTAKPSIDCAARAPCQTPISRPDCMPCGDTITLVQQQRRIGQPKRTVGRGSCRYTKTVSRGEHWAHHADCARELSLLQGHRTGKSAAQWQAWFVAPGRIATGVHAPGPAAAAGHAQRTDDIAAFWRQAVTFDAGLPQRVLRNPEFVRGFADGALDVWAKSGGAGERGSEVPDENWLDREGGPSSQTDT